MPDSDLPTNSVLANTVARFEGEMRRALEDVKTGQNRVADHMDELKEALPEKFLPRREFEDWRRQTGERQGETELQVIQLRAETKAEFEKRDKAQDATRKLALTGVIFPIVSGVTVGIILLMVGLLG